MKTIGSILLAFVCLAANATSKPNILLILADDLGYSDLGCYGGEIRTPNLDALAADGVRFAQFYNSARCCPSRASLLTGQYPHAVGFAGMSGTLPEHCVTIPEVLKPAGYRTLMCGKWHLGTPGPVKRGFEEFFGMLGGYGSFWNPQLYTRLPKDRPLRPCDNFYATDAITDYALDFIGEARRSDKPWFLYLAYNAPHFPLHTPKEEIAKYADTYTKGWDAIRVARYQRQKELGVIDPRWVLSPRSVIPPNAVATMHGWSNKENPTWDSIPAERRADLARRMAVFAAMVDRMDQNIGRVMADLRRRGEFDNTLIFFLSDNGACAEAAGAGYPHQRVEGHSLLPVLRGEMDTPRTLFFEHEKSRAVRQGKWKLAALAGQPWELYDMDADGTELNDLAAGHPDKVKELAALWDGWWQRTTQKKK